ncbi:233_t:CDS:1, partial [Entrophospora sp. SA101]
SSNDNHSRNKESDIPKTLTKSNLPSKYIGVPATDSSTNKKVNKEKAVNRENLSNLKKLVNELLSTENPPQDINHIGI